MSKLHSWIGRQRRQMSSPPASKAASLNGSGTHLMTSLKFSKEKKTSSSVPLFKTSKTSSSVPLFKTSKTSSSVSYPDALLAEVLWAGPPRVGDPFIECASCQRVFRGHPPLAPTQDSKLPLQCLIQDFKTLLFSILSGCPAGGGPLGRPTSCG